jgi:hypothetical protein
MPKDIRGLSINIGTKTAGFERGVRRYKRGVKRMEDSTNKFKKNLKGVKGAVLAAFGTAAIAGMGLAIRKLTKDSLAFADALGKNADRIGISTDALQEYAFAADLAGISQDTLEKGLLKLNDTLGDAALNGGATARAVDQLGLSLDELKDPSNRLQRIVRALADVKDETKRAALAADLFGRSGRDMLTLIGSGPGALDASIDKFKEFNLGIGAQLVDNAEAATDAITLLSKQIETIKLNLILAFADELETVLGFLSNVTKFLVDLAKDEINPIEDFFLDSAVAVEILNTKLTRFLGVEKIGLLESMSDAFFRLSEGIEKVPEKIKTGVVLDIPSRAPRANIDLPNLRLFGTKDKEEPTFDDNPLDSKKFDEFIEDADRFSRQIRATFSAIGKAIDEAASSALDGFGDAFARLIVDGENFADSMREVFKQLARDIISELAKIALIKTIGAIANVALPGAGVGVGIAAGQIPSAANLPVEPSGFSGGLPRVAPKAAEIVLQLDGKRLGRAMVDLGVEGKLSAPGFKLVPEPI